MTVSISVGVGLLTDWVFVTFLTCCELNLYYVKEKNTCVFFSNICACPLLSTREQLPWRNSMPRTPAGPRAWSLPPKQWAGAPRSWCKYQSSPESLKEIKVLKFIKFAEGECVASSCDASVNVSKHEFVDPLLGNECENKQNCQSGFKRGKRFRTEVVLTLLWSWPPR